MREKFSFWTQFTAIFMIALLAFGILQFVGTNRASANNTPQTLPFTQNWTNVGLITADDNWSGVPGIIGYRGDDLSATIDVDLRTILANGSGTPVDVNANRSDPDVFASGGIVEFDGIPNPTVAMQGSATADIPHLVIHLNTTGQSNIQVAYNARDIDNGTGVDAAQQINTQFRVGGTGDYQNVTGGYFADVTSPGGATQVTPVNVTLPAAANNQALVEVRIMTTNAIGSDEFVGIDDINITGTGGPVVTTDAPVDFNGDGKTDYAVVRNIGGGANGQLQWYSTTGNAGAPTSYQQWGLNLDVLVPADYDGDQKDDIAVYRPGSAFYIFQSETSTVRIDVFGQTGDNATVVGDYDGDGKDDVSVYRPGASAGAQSTWFYRGTLNNPARNITFIPWGVSGDFPSPGDYDGDGKYDFVIQRDGGANAQFWQLLSGGGTNVVTYGLPTDFIISGDFDGDRKTDLAVTRVMSNNRVWYVRPSGGGTFQPTNFGITGDVIAPGDYDGDGKTDLAIWRPGVAGNGTGRFIVRSSLTGAIIYRDYGLEGDRIPARSFVH